MSRLPKAWNKNWESENTLNAPGFSAVSTRLLLETTDQTQNGLVNRPDWRRALRYRNGRFITFQGSHLAWGGGTGRKLSIRHEMHDKIRAVEKTFKTPMFWRRKTGEFPEIGFPGPAAWKGAFAQD